MHRRRNRQFRRKQQNTDEKSATTSGNTVENKTCKGGIKSPTMAKSDNGKAGDVKPSDKKANSDDVPNTIQNIGAPVSTDEKLEIEKPDDVVNDSAFETATPNIDVASDQQIAKSDGATENPNPGTDFAFETATPNINVASDQQIEISDVTTLNPNPGTDFAFETATPNINVASDQQIEKSDVTTLNPNPGTDFAFETATPNIDVASDQQIEKSDGTTENPNPGTDFAFETTTPNIDVASDQQIAKSDVTTEHPNPGTDFAFETATPNIDVASDQEIAKSDVTTENLNPGTDFAFETATPNINVASDQKIAKSDVTTENANPGTDFAFETATPNIDVASDQQIAKSDVTTENPNPGTDFAFETATPNINVASDQKIAKSDGTTENPNPGTDLSRCLSSNVDPPQCETAENPAANLRGSAKRRFNRRKRKEEAAANAQLEKEKETETPTSTNIEKPKNNENTEGNNDSNSPSGSKHRRRRRKNHNSENEQTSTSSASTSPAEKKSTQNPDCRCCLSKLADGWKCDPFAGPSTSTKTDDECFADFINRVRIDPSVLMMRNAWDATCQALEKTEDPSNVVVNLLKEINSLLAHHDRAADFIRRHTEAKMAMQGKGQASEKHNQIRNLIAEKTALINSRIMGKAAMDIPIAPSYKAPKYFKKPRPVRVVKEVMSSSSDISDDDDDDEECYSFENRNEVLYNYIWGNSNSPPPMAQAEDIKTVSKFDCPDKPLNIAPYQNIFNIKYGIGVILIKNLLYPITKSSLINGFGTFGQLIYHSERKMKMDKGIKKVVAIVYKTRLHAAVAAMNLESQFDQEEEFTLVTSGSRKKDQKVAMEFLGIGFCYGKYDVIPMNTVERNILDDAVENFQKVLYYCTS